MGANSTSNADKKNPALVVAAVTLVTAAGTAILIGWPTKHNTAGKEIVASSAGPVVASPVLAPANETVATAANVASGVNTASSASSTAIAPVASPAATESNPAKANAAPTKVTTPVATVATVSSLPTVADPLVAVPKVAEPKPVTANTYTPVKHSAASTKRHIVKASKHVHHIAPRKTAHAAHGSTHHHKVHKRASGGICATCATVLTVRETTVPRNGAVSGAIADHAAGKPLDQDTKYKVTVHFDNGKKRTYVENQASNFKHGDRIRVKNGQLKSI